MCQPAEASSSFFQSVRLCRARGGFGWFPVVVCELLVLLALQILCSESRRTHTHKRTHTQSHTHTHKNTQTRRHTDTRTHGHTDTRTQRQTDTHTHTCTLAHLHTCTLAHTHTHTYSHSHSHSRKTLQNRRPAAVVGARKPFQVFLVSRGSGMGFSQTKPIPNPKPPVNLNRVPTKGEYASSSLQL